MTETLQVPAGHLSDFRAAMVKEVAFSASRVEESRAELAKLRERDGERYDGQLGEAMSWLARDAKLMLDIEAALSDDSAIDLRVSADFEVLAHVCEAMAREVVGKRLHDLLFYGPIDRDLADRIAELAERLRWAADHSAELHGRAFEAQVRGGGS